MNISTQLFFISTVATNKDDGTQYRIDFGTMRQFKNGQWIWAGLGRSSRYLPTKEACVKSMRRSFGKDVFLSTTKALPL